MSGQQIIAARLGAFAGLTALVGDRVYPDILADPPTYPSVTFQKVGGGSAKGATSDPPLKHGTFQVTAWAKSRVDALAISTQIRLALDRMRQVTVGGVAVDDCFYQGDVDLFDFETRVYYTHNTFLMHYRDPA